MSGARPEARDEPGSWSPRGRGADLASGPQRTLQDTVCAITSRRATRQNLWPPTGTRGRAPSWSCLALWTASATMWKRLSAMPSGARTSGGAGAAARGVALTGWAAPRARVRPRRPRACAFSGRREGAATNRDSASGERRLRHPSQARSAGSRTGVAERLSFGFLMRPGAGRNPGLRTSTQIVGRSDALDLGARTRSTHTV